MNRLRFISALLASLLLADAALSTPQPPLDDYDDMVVALLRDAIARETTVGRGQVPAYAESLRQVFLRAGFSKEDLVIAPLGETASLIVRYAGDDSSGRKPILFSSHMDVVTADPESWLRHPF